MRKDEIIAIKKMIDEASVISFDVIDTLLFRIVNEPETIFDIVGKHFGIHGFRKLRIDSLNIAKRKMFENDSCAYVNINDIYDVISEHEEIPADWNDVKAFELQVEEDAFTVNTDMLEIYNYARNSGKYVIAVSDTHLSVELIGNILGKNGYIGFDAIYCLAEEHKYKSILDFFDEILQKENIKYEDILHIGGSAPECAGIETCLYQRSVDVKKINNVPDSDIDKGLYRVLYQKEQGFWYNFGIEVGGPFYMALAIWLLDKIKNNKQKIYFVSNSGYYLYRILKNSGYSNIEYLSVSKEDILNKNETEVDEKVVKLISEDSIVFDSDWSGSFQYRIECFKKSIDCKTKTIFYYPGIYNTVESRKQLHRLHYEAFLFDFYRNFALQSGIKNEANIYKILGLGMYASNLELESKDNCWEKEQLLKGILDYVSKGIDFAQKYEVDYSPDKAVSHLQRLVMYPTNEEALKIGLVKSVATKSNFEKKFSEYHLEDDQSIRNYYRWIGSQKEYSEIEIKLTYRPKFSVVVPVYNTETEQLEECIHSVLLQTYDNFELILVDDHSSWENVVPVLKEFEGNEKVHVIYRTANGHISEATNDGIASAQGDFIAFMDCDDTIEPDALYEMAKKINENTELDFIYSDEDKITEDGKIRHLPFFKPDWSPDLYLCMNYTNHLSVYRTSIVKEIGGLRSAYNGSQDYDFTLRFMEKSTNWNVGHVPKVLYHWRERRESAAFAMSSKNYALDTAKNAKEDWIRRNNIAAHLEYIYGKLQYRIIYEVQGNPLISIIIPSKDNVEILQQCIDSIYDFTRYQNYEIIVVDNGSSDSNKMKISEYLRSRKASYIYERETFNFSRMCNKGARRAKGDYLLFLNDDVEVFQPEWMERMLGHAQRPHVGAVGAKLFYPETTKIQHAGVANIKEGPSHNFCGHDDQQMLYFGFNWVEYNCIAVTGACLMVSADRFCEINGFDESLPVSYNDVCLCFSLHQAGYYNVVRNDVVLYHYESYSRGYDYLDDAKMLRLSVELEKLYLRFPDLARKDPYLNRNLHLYGANLELSVRCGRLEPIDLKGAVEKGQGNIDSIEVTDCVRIVGWSILDDVDILDRSIVFEDSFGNVFQAQTLSMMRQDVVGAFGGECKYRYSGFECILPKSELRIDILPYKIGILSYDEIGNRYITWWNRQSNVMRNTKVRPVMCAYVKYDNFVKHVGQADTCWHIDYINENEIFYDIAGFAFHTGENHFKYQISLVLEEKNNIAYEFEIHKEERIDVAAAFPEQHFLYNTGFKCIILKDILQSDKEYDIIIRLSNQFDSDDIIDILTQKSIE